MFLIRTPTRKATLLQKYSVLSLCAFVLVGVGFGGVASWSVAQNYVSRSKQYTAYFVQEEFKLVFQRIDFSRPLEGDVYEDVRDRSSHLTSQLAIKRVKIWNRDMTVVWSDDRRLLGQRFPDNHELKEALEGAITSEIKTPQKTENVFERRFSRLLELYVPVHAGPDGIVDTVFEIYQDLGPLDADVGRQQTIIWVTTGLAFAAVYLAGFGIVWRASARLEAQTRDLRDSEDKYHSLVESAPDAIIAIGRHGTVTMFNKAAERVFGYKASEVLGRPLTMLIPDPYRGRHEDGIRQVAATGTFHGSGAVRDCEGLRKDGRTFPVELSLSVARDREDLMITCFLRDVSERKAMQDRLIDAEKQALVSVIASSIGHEMNNSLQGVWGYSQLLEKRPGDVELAKRCAQVYSGHSQRLHLHAKNLLALGTPRQPELKPLDIVVVLDRVTEMLTQSGVLKRFTVRKEYPDCLPLVLGDEVLLEQVIMNLEINASHAMVDHGILTVRGALSADGTTTEFSVSDTGHGIPESVKDRIFDPFFTTKEKGKGTGLGLFVVKQVVEQHAGTIEVQSVPGEGATFSIRIPADRIGVAYADRSHIPQILRAVPSACPSATGGA